MNAAVAAPPAPEVEAAPDVELEGDTGLNLEDVQPADLNEKSAPNIGGSLPSAEEPESSVPAMSDFNSFRAPADAEEPVAEQAPVEDDPVDEVVEPSLGPRPLAGPLPSSSRAPVEEAEVEEPEAEAEVEPEPEPEIRAGAGAGR